MHMHLANDFGVVKEVKVGFSWTMFFFGGFVPLFRGDIKWFFITWLVAIFTAGLSAFVFPFLYNKIYIKELLEKGYHPTNEGDKQVLMAHGIILYQHAPLAQRSNPAPTPQRPQANESIKKLLFYKDLLEKGLITEEEFLAKKKEIL